MRSLRVATYAAAFFLALNLHAVHAIPSTEKLNWGPDFYEMTCKPAVKTRTYVELWPLLTHEERSAVNTAQQLRYIREQDLYRSWMTAFEEVLGTPERVKVRGHIYPATVYERYGIDMAYRGASDTLAACVEHMAKQMAMRR
ncbi:hypothetical protein YTPLAS18_20450 [Nitrospira sp.]|nr:hypothetical protein YTPLAS18_20450 [Nitrospira sp.]